MLAGMALILGGVALVNRSPLNSGDGSSIAG
jgi:hypothetical protein